MKQIFILLIWSATFFIVAAQSDKIKSIDSLIEAANGIGVFNGTVLIAREGKIVYQKETGFADTSKTKFIKPDSRFAIGSITKEFNSVGILLLQEKGKLNIDDKISKYLPELPKWADKIQIKHLLQYTSGLPQSNADSD